MARCSGGLGLRHGPRSLTGSTPPNEPSLTPSLVSATYVVPVPTPMGTAEARQKASTAVETRLTGPLRTLTAEWLAKGAVKVGVEAAGPLPSGLLDRELFGTPEQRVFLARARAFVRFSATQRASLIGMQEWKAREAPASLHTATVRNVPLGRPIHAREASSSSTRIGSATATHCTAAAAGPSPQLQPHWGLPSWSRSQQAARHWPQGCRRVRASAGGARRRASRP